MKCDNFIRMILLIICAFVFILNFQGPVFSAPKGEKVLRHNLAEKEIQGVVTGISKKNISVLYSVNDGEESEILIPYDANKLQIQHKRRFSEIKVGDTVNVKYEEDFKKFESGREDLRVKARVVSFVKSAPVKVVNPEVLNSDLQPAGQ